MDLRHDWKSLNEVLFKPSSGEGAGLGTTGSSLVLLEDGGKVIDGAISNGLAFAETGLESISDKKEILDRLATKYGVEQTVVLQKKTLDQLVIEAAALGTNYFQQLQSLRRNVINQLGKKQDGLVVSRRHFVLDLFGSRLRRILPRRFNVLLFVDQRMSMTAAPFSYRAIMLSYSSGQLDQFFEPDFSSLHENRLQHWDLESPAIGQYLESRYILPCYGIFMHQPDWESCLEAVAQKRKPWRQFVRFYDEMRAAVYPNRFLAKALLATQRLMVYFGRL